MNYCKKTEKIQEGNDDIWVYFVRIIMRLETFFLALKIYWRFSSNFDHSYKMDGWQEGDYTRVHNWLRKAHEGQEMR